MSEAAPDIPVEFSISGDGPAIDFANTANWHASETPIESLTGYDRLVAWGRGSGLFDAAESARLLEDAAERPEAATAALAGAIELREAIYHVFSAAAAGSPLPEADLALLNDALPGALSRLRLAADDSGSGFAWTWQADDDLLWFLAPVVRAAADLLVSPEVAHLRECAGHPCGWIFLDHSRNHTRRWCSMADCGNRAKARRHYQRAKATRAEEALHG